jgi:phosphoribosylanthranilate isomerase
MANPVKVKICGITNFPDAEAAVAAGADLLGFMFWDRSSRHLELAAAGEIARRLPPPVLKVGVFVDAPAEAVRQAIAVCGLDLLQFHGEETPEYCLQFEVPSVKAFRIRGRESLRALPRYATQAWLLDAYTPGKVGGTGEKFDWDLALEARRLGRPIFLAGGLTPGNVADAVARVQPYAVDVSSGVEAAPGKKDHAKLRAFIQAAKGQRISET